MRRRLACAVQILPVIMPSLPISEQWTDAGSDWAAASLPSPNIGSLASEDERCLANAFRSFARVAHSLESSYVRLRTEVDRLRRELEESNSERARGAEENRRMRMFLDSVLEGLPCGVLVADAAGRFARVNPEGMRLIGSDVSTPTGSLSALKNEMRAFLARASKETGLEQEVGLTEEDGSRRWLAARHAWLTESCEGPSIFILRDTTERRRLDKMEDRMMRDQALAEISALLAHEIRNPLGSLELFAGLLAESALAPETRSWVQHIQAGLRTLAATVNNVLHFHSLPEPERLAVDVEQLLDWSRDFCAPLAMQSSITMSLQPCGPGLIISADRHRLEQVLLNLVLNGIRAMPAGGWIELRARKLAEESQVEIVVADTGPGISAEDLPRIFDAGFSRRSGSPGLGLAVCRKIVQQHKGTIAAASDPGRGASFTLRFPLATEMRVPIDAKGVQR